MELLLQTVILELVEFKVLIQPVGAFKGPTIAVERVLVKFTEEIVLILLILAVESDVFEFIGLSLAF